LAKKRKRTDEVLNVERIGDLELSILPPNFFERNPKANRRRDKNKDRKKERFKYRERE